MLWVLNSSSPYNLSKFKESQGSKWNFDFRLPRLINLDSRLNWCTFYLSCSTLLGCWPVAASHEIRMPSCHVRSWRDYRKHHSESICHSWWSWWSHPRTQMGKACIRMIMPPFDWHDHDIFLVRLNALLLMAWKVMLNHIHSFLFPILFSFWVMSSACSSFFLPHFHLTRTPLLEGPPAPGWESAPHTSWVRLSVFIY